MHLEFEPNIGAAPLTFGTNRNLVRARLAPLVPKTQTAEPESDFYTKQGLILGFDQQNKLAFMRSSRLHRRVWRDSFL